MKKIISLAVALIMVLALVPAIASAQVTEVVDEAGLLAAMTVGGEVRLGADILVDDAGIAPFQTEVILDLFGHTLTFTASDIKFSNTGKLTLQDSSANGNGKVVSSGGNCLCATQGGELIINGGNIDSEWYGLFVTSTGKLTMNGGSLLVRGIGAQGICGNGSAGLGGTVITINGGSIKTEDRDNVESLGIYHPQDGTLNINGGQITGGTGITMMSGTLNMKGGTITGTAKGAPVVENSNGSKGSGSALCLLSNQSYQNGITVEIDGGVINSTYTYAVDHYKWNAEVSKVTGVTVDNATITTPMASAAFGIEADKLTIAPTANVQTGVTTLVRANAAPTFVVTIPAIVDFGELVNDAGTKEVAFNVELKSALLDPGAQVKISVTSDFEMSNSGAGRLGYWIDHPDTTNESGHYWTFTQNAIHEGIAKCIDTITQAGAYTDTMVFGITYVPVA